MRCQDTRAQHVRHTNHTNTICFNIATQPLLTNDSLLSDATVIEKACTLARAVVMKDLTKERVFYPFHHESYSALARSLYGIVELQERDLYELHGKVAVKWSGRPYDLAKFR